MKVPQKAHFRPVVHLASLFAIACGSGTAANRSGIGYDGGDGEAGGAGGAQTASGGVGGGGAATGGSGGKAPGSSGGAAAAGGQTGSGGVASAGGSTSTGGAVQHVVLPCDKVTATGTWEQITPPGVNLSPSHPTPAGPNYGVHAIAVNPKNTATVYLGTTAQGMYKTTDCGATWAHVNTGRNAAKIDSGRQWTFVMDPEHPDTLYTNTGYGENGAWKSTNGGVDWDPLIPAKYMAALQFGGFVHMIAMNPKDPRHLVVTPHFECEVGKVDGAPATKECVLETKDAGGTWRVMEGVPGSQESGGPWLSDSQTWFISQWGNGLWRSVDAGATWTKVITGGYSTPGEVRIQNKVYIGGVFNVLESADNGATWQAIPGSPNADFVESDGKIVIAARTAAYSYASTADMTKWTALPSPPVAEGHSAWSVKYDGDHRIVYGAHNLGGFWRLKLP